MWEINPNPGKLKCIPLDVQKIKTDVGMESDLHKDALYNSHVFKYKWSNLTKVSRDSRCLIDIILIAYIYIRDNNYTGRFAFCSFVMSSGETP